MPVAVCDDPLREADTGTEAHQGTTAQYHEPQAGLLHAVRRHLGGSVLVIGDGTPGLPAAIGDIAASVTVVAGDASEAGAIAAACRHLPGLRALVPSDLPGGERFDAVVVIDPTRCAWRGAPASDLLSGIAARARARLKPGGRLVLGSENALALGRFAGGGEVPGRADLFSLEGRHRPDGFTLPTRRGLRHVLGELGLAEQAWWFPFPDLRQPLSLIAERGLDGPYGFEPGALAAEAAPFDLRRPPAPAFSAQRAWPRVAEAGLLGDLAPAFVVVASEAALPDDARLALHIGHRRRVGFDRLVTFEAAGAALHVVRTPLHPRRPSERGGIVNRFPNETFVPGRAWQAGLIGIVARDGWTVAEVVAWATTWQDAVRTVFAEGAILSRETPLPGRALDAIPRNLFLKDGQPRFIDLEWEITEDFGAPLDFGHLLLRALVNALTDVETCGDPAGEARPTLLDLLRAVSAGLGVPLDDDAIRDRLVRESRFQSVVSGVETVRSLAWLASSGLPYRSAGRAATARADEDVARLRAENAVLVAERASGLEALAEARRRTDRVILHAAALDRARHRSETARAVPSDAPSRGRLRRLAARCLGLRT